MTAYPSTMRSIICLLLLCPLSFTSAQNADIPIVDFNRPIGLSLDKSDEANALALKSYQDIVSAIPRFKKDLDKAAQRYIESLRKIATAQNSFHKKIETADRLFREGKTMTPENWWIIARNDLQAAENSAQMALVRWSAQYSRYHRLQARRISMLSDIYDLRPIHVQRIEGDDGEFYEWIDDDELVQWWERVDNAWRAIIQFQRNIDNLLVNQRQLESEYASLGKYIDELSVDYRNRLEKDLATRTLTDIAVSLTNLAGGGIGLALEAGYQSMEWFAYTAGDGGKGWLNNYSFDWPPLSAELRSRIQGESRRALEYEVAEAEARWRRKPLLQQPWEIDVAAGGKAGASTDGLTADIETRFPTSDFILGQLQGAGINIAQSEDIYLALEGAALRKIYGDDAISSVGRVYFEGTVTPFNLKLKLEDRLTPIRNAMTDHNKWIVEQGTGIGISVGAAALGEIYKDAVSKMGRSRAVIIAESAIAEVVWLTKRRQMVAHRLLTERYLRQANTIQDDLFRLISNPPPTVRSAKRRRNRLDDPAIRLRGDKQINVTFNYSDPGSFYLMFAYPLDIQVLVSPEHQDAHIRDLISKPWDEVEVQLQRKEVSRTTDVTYDGKRLQKQGGGVGFFVYPMTWKDGSSKNESTNKFFLDFDSSTPVTHFDDESLTWAGQESYLTPNSLYRFDLVKAVKVKLRNAEQIILVTDE